MQKVVIIGGGVAGLSAGIFAQMNGFNSVILEKHHTLGGECTGWDRRGYHIDGCIHWLVGTKEGTAMHDLWVTLGALDGVECYHPDSFMTVEQDGVEVNLYRDLDKLQSSWITISPQDTETINDFCATIRKLQSFQIGVAKPLDMMNIVEKIRYFASMKDAGAVMQKYGKIALTQYAERFKHPALRRTLAEFVPDGYSASSIFFALATFTQGQASIPSGGSKAMALRMVDRYLEFGGQIETRCEIAELVHERGQVQRVVAKDGRSFSGDHFVAACDPKVLFHDLLDDGYSDKAFEMRYQNQKDYPLASNIYIGLGYEGTMNGIPRTLRFPVEPIKILQTSINNVQLTHYGYEPNFAPARNTVLTVAINQFADECDAWLELAKHNEAYKHEKARIGEAVRQSIIQRFPEMAGKLQVLDVASPATYNRYCNAHRGAFMAFLPTTTGKPMAHNGRIKGLRNLHLSGQWLQPPGGLPVAAVTGKDTIQRICKDQRRPFTMGTSHH